ncbi:hypothetical protein EVAR_69397_1 [Eumeta japonica]|uniref:Uncharacterized protein n=1 Tax=Eumeta variegata TaxID=151549 RepID=A0A4C2AGU7_EUMVA|nr:hypothetical protein EVAR_69397_1 [Eumeta japonica]
MPREELMEQRLAEMHVHLQFLETLYNARQEELLAVQVKFLQSKNNNSQERSAASTHLYGISQSSLTPELRALLRNVSGK